MSLSVFMPNMETVTESVNSTVVQTIVSDALNDTEAWKDYDDEVDLPGADNGSLALYAVPEECRLWLLLSAGKLWISHDDCFETTIVAWNWPLFHILIQDSAWLENHVSSRCVAGNINAGKHDTALLFSCFFYFKGENE